MKPRHGIIAGIVLVALAIVAYLVFAGDDAPGKLTLGERAVEVDGGGETTGPSVEFSNVLGCNIPVPVTDAAFSVADVSVSRLSVVEGSIAGYRVVEDFIGGLANVDAVGRTTSVQGDMFLMSGFNWWDPGDEDHPTTTTAPPNPQLMAAWVCVDVASIKSDKGSRDNRFRTTIMETANFPVATFVAVPSNTHRDSDVPVTGATTISIPGTLTMVGKEVAVRASVTIQKGAAPDSYELVAQIPVVFSDFGIDNPSNSIVSVRDEGLIEVSLAFAWNGTDPFGRG